MLDKTVQQNRGETSNWVPQYERAQCSKVNKQQQLYTMPPHITSSPSM